ncbi:hypothetical protein HMPREF9057_02590 [Actinomyces sp. oral taxon 171 str. F0337]|nr:hypothetical protein HMPREF9057_02590 [Actinomyces sp. oral taxon 171 str. F0337]
MVISWSGMPTCIRGAQCGAAEGPAAALLTRAVRIHRSQRSIRMPCSW